MEGFGLQLQLLSRGLSCPLHRSQPLSGGWATAPEPCLHIAPGKVSPQLLAGEAGAPQSWVTPRQLQGPSPYPKTQCLDQAEAASACRCGYRDETFGRPGHRSARQGSAPGLRDGRDGLKSRGRGQTPQRLPQERLGGCRLHHGAPASCPIEQYATGV